MAESKKLRLVRCPKCENLLSEPEDSPFFQCGGCFTVLRAKMKESEEADSVSEKSIEEDRAKPVSVSSSSPEKPIVDSFSEETESSDSDAVPLRRNQPNLPVSAAVESSDPCSKPVKEDPKSQSGRFESGLDRFKQRTTKRCDSDSVLLLNNNNNRLSTSKYPSNEGTSSANYIPNSKDHQSDEAAIELDRAGLLRQLDKLKEQLVQSCNVATSEKPKEQVPSGSNKAPGPPLRFYSAGNHPYYHHQQQQVHEPMYPPYGGFQMHGRGGGSFPPPPHPYFSGQQYNDNNDVYPQQNGHFHHSSCSCYHCYAPYNAGFYPHDSVMGFAPPPPPPHNPPRAYGSRPLGRWPSDPQMDGFSRIRQPHHKVVLSNGYRHIRPLAGGAPFITCQNCFELLQLPKKQPETTTRGGGGAKKLRCGACACLMDLSVVDNKYVISTNTMKQEEEEAARGRGPDYTSDDYDLLGYVFHSLDDDEHEPRDLQNVHSHSASLSEEEEEEDELSSDSLTAKPLAQDSPLRDNFDYCLINQDRSGVGSRSSRSEQDRVITLSKRQNSMKEVSLASEMEVSYSDYNNSGVSKDHQQQQRSKKIGFASIVKKSFKDLTKSIQNDEGNRSSNVSVNGHSLTERSMKKAEKQAGVIQPGNYWYDYRAGFWGLMGGPCLGILPPFIEELNYPMPENCAGGTTGVFVNGRELHRKDLDLLAARGLPSERDRSYIVDITGKVIDEDTGEELDCLGKLAPTIEKLKRGFGMRLPKRVAM